MKKVYLKPSEAEIKKITSKLDKYQNDALYSMIQHIIIELRVRDKLNDILCPEI